MTTFYSDDLINRLKNGSKSAFESLYTEYWEEIYLNALKRVGDEDIAKEITQELFIHLWEKRESLAIRETIQAYLHGAVKYRVINYFRSAITREKYHHDLSLLIGETVINETESSHAVKEIEQALHLILAKMPGKMRRIFEMSRLEQKTVAEISGELNLSGQTVKNQLTSALKIVRKHFSLPALLILFIYS